MRRVNDDQFALRLGKLRPKRHGTEMPSQNATDYRFLYAYGALLVASVGTFGALSGVWLDEFWQIRLSHGYPDVASLFRDSLLHDTHPVLFNSLAALFSGLANGDPWGGRLISAASAFLFLTGSLWALARRYPAERPFFIALWFLVIAAPGNAGFSQAVANFRSYVWIAAFAVLQVSIMAIVARAPGDLDARQNRLFAAACVAVTAIAIQLHYVNAIFACVIAAATFVLAWAYGKRGWMVAMGAGLLIGIVMNVATILMQIPNWRAFLDYAWLSEQGGSRFSLFVWGAIKPFLFNVVALFAFGIYLLRNTDRRLPLALIAALALGMMIAFGFHMLQPMVTYRYLVTPTIIALACLALGMQALWHRKMLVHMFALVSLLVLGVQYGAARPRAGWGGSAQLIAARVKACPSTRVLATTGWVFSSGRGSKAARNEEPVFWLGYRHLGRAHGFTPEIIVDGTSRAVPVGPCPTLLWIEHALNVPKDITASEALKRSGVTLQGDAALSLSKTDGGLIITATPKTMAKTT